MFVFELESVISYMPIFDNSHHKQHTRLRPEEKTHPQKYIPPVNLF